MSALAQLGEFPALSQFSAIAHANAFSATPLVVARLTKVAEILGHPTDQLVEPLDQMVLS